MDQSKIKIIGIGGLARSGKDTLAELFLERGYYGESAGDIVRKYCVVRHAKDSHPIARVNMTETSNWLRGEKGPNFYMEDLIANYQKHVDAGKEYKGIVAWSIRASVEVDYILARSGEVIWVECSDEVRHARNTKYLRPGEPLLSLKDFLAQEAPQWEPQPGIPEDVQMNVSYVKAHAIHVLNNGSDDKEEFINSANKLIDSL